jgi:universal stress protein E
MTVALSKIMVVIDPTQEQQPAFERALDSARLTGARLHLYVCLDPDPAENIAQRTADECDGLLVVMMQRAQNDGIEASSELEVAENWGQQAVAAAARCSASMVFKNSQAHSSVQRQLRSTSDWTLLRFSPCPVLLVKNFRDWKHRCVLAAVNCDTKDEAHLKLNNQIISFAQRFSDAYGSDAHFVCAYKDRNRVPHCANLAETCGSPEEYMHVVEGNPVDAITATAESLEVDLIIIGTVGRTGLKGTVVGNTSERLLDQTRSDVLVLN